MNGKKAALIGATGLIGSHLLDLLIKDDRYEQIKVIVRREVNISHPKVIVDVIDFSDLDAYKLALSGVDMVFCAVGTTNKKVKGDKDAYRKVDHDIPVHAAKLSSQQGVGQFLLVSAIGADSKSKVFYTWLKGKVEDSIREMGLPSVSIFRPSLLLGSRGEFRLGEKVSGIIMRLLFFLIPSIYKPIHAHDVARSMLAAASQGRPGVNIYQYKEMMLLSSSEGKGQ